MSETTELERQVVEFCDKHPKTLCYKQKTEGNRGRNSNPIEKKGKSDLGGCYRMFAFYPETKIGNDKQSDDQKRFEKMANEAEGYYFTYGSFDEFLRKFTLFTIKVDRMHEMISKTL